MSKPKEKAWEWCSRYIRLRDALDYCKRMGIDISQFSRPEDIIVKCCTCPKRRSWIDMQAGHYFGRGLAGGSGTFFDERNIHTQCGQCNGFKQGNNQVYTEFMLNKYGQQVIDELEIKHRGGSKYSHIQLKALAQFYKEKYEELLASV